MGRQMHWRRLAIELAAVVGIAVIVALLAPFGVLHRASAADRLAYWLRTLLLGYLMLRPLWGAVGLVGASRSRANRSAPGRPTPPRLRCAVPGP